MTVNPELQLASHTLPKVVIVQFACALVAPPRVKAPQTTGAQAKVPVQAPVAPHVKFAVPPVYPVAQVTEHMSPNSVLVQAAELELATTSAPQFSLTH